MGYFLLSDCINYDGKGHDFKCEFFVDETSVGVLCDGVSSTFDPAFGARTVSLQISNSIRNCFNEKIDQLSYQELYQSAVNHLYNQYVHLPFQHDRQHSCYATTVLTAVVRSGWAEFSYCGNGGIFEIRPEWFSLPTEIPTPWGITNYLNPHTCFIDGENRLIRSINAMPKEGSWMPDVLSLKRTAEGSSYFFICTDGLYSSDEISTAWDERDAQYYIMESRRLLLFLEIIRKYHQSKWQERENFKLEFAERLNEEHLMADDLSYILFVPEP